MNDSWFSHDRFGMFIHWGLYSLAGGRYKNMETPWVSEWIMRKFKIPVAEYEKLASRFNPVKFDAEKWVESIQNAGMKYLVITAKHHDGFAMFHSEYDRFNIVDATPFKRDVLKELSHACEKQKIRLGFYYSQDQDWHESGASGNTWDFPEQTDAGFQKYLDAKVKKQLTELLTNYGKVSILWFDTPVKINAEQSQKLKDFVHELQPDCLVSGRVGNGKGDYESLGDNQLPEQPAVKLTEGLGTMNESWGYKPFDRHYRSSSELLNILSKMASKNANYLLNVGPDEKGEFPAPARKRLKEIGSFLRVNGEALYGAKSTGMIQAFQFKWGNVTAKGNAVYFWILNSVRSVEFYGIRNKKQSAAILSSGEKIGLQSVHNDENDYHKTTLKLPAKVKTPYVIKLQVEEELSVNEKSYFAN